MFEFIAKLRKKSDKSKKRIAMLSAFSIVGSVFIVWITVIYPSFINMESKENEAKKSSPSPLSAFAYDVSGGFSAIREQISKMKDYSSSFFDKPEYYSASTTNDVITPENLPDGVSNTNLETMTENVGN